MVWVIAAPAFTLAAFVVTVMLPREARNAARWISIAAVAGSTIVSAILCLQVLQADIVGDAEFWSFSWTLATIGGQPLDLSFRVDALSAVLAFVVSLVGLCVEVFSLGYLRDDERKGWFFCVFSLFVTAMLVFVLSGDLLLAFIGWEIMGLCSYFLIGFYFEEEEPRKASIKAFLVTRVGDIGFLFALAVIYQACGTFDLVTVLGAAPSWDSVVATEVAIGLLVAAMGKSAQVPLHIWLPDAMAGPTPASAMIHAATMVAAGIILVARTMPVFLASPGVLVAMFVIGIATAFIGGLIACVQDDVKKVLAYSTISQLGLMFSVLGVAGIAAALFHLVAHAFFKSLLFLGSGSIIHATGTQDMHEMGGLRKKMPITWLTFLIGTLALVGVPPLSGFFSKDGILSTFFGAGFGLGAALVALASVLTAFYMARMYFYVFEGESKHEPHSERDVAMLLPLVVLACVTLVLGWAGPGFSELLGVEGEYPTAMLVMSSIAIVVVGAGMGWWLYGRRKPAAFVAKQRANPGVVVRVLAKKLYFDIVLDKFIVRPFRAFAELTASFDRSGIDGAVNGIARLTKSFGRGMRRIQTGELQSYQRMVLSAVVILMICALSGMIVMGV